MISLHKNRLGFIVGARGSGKSTLAKELVKNTDKVVVWDVLDEYGPGISSLRQLEQDIQAKKRLIIFKAKLTDRATFNQVLKLIYHYGNYLLLAEEFNCVLPNQAGLTDQESIFLSTSRHRNAGMVGVSRRPADVNQLFLSQCEDFFIFRTNLPADVDRLEKYIGKAAESLPSLQTGDFIYFNGMKTEKMRLNMGKLVKKREEIKKKK